MILGAHRRLLVGLVLLSLPAAAYADDHVAVRAGSHDDFGRVVFDLPPGATWQLTRDGDRVMIRFGPGVMLGAAPASPRNVVSLNSTADQAELVVAEGATLQSLRIGDRLAIDVHDPAPTQPTPSAPPAAAAASSPAGAGKQAVTPAPAPTAVRPATPQAAPAQGTPVKVTPGKPASPDGKPEPTQIAPSKPPPAGRKAAPEVTTPPPALPLAKPVPPAGASSASVRPPSQATDEQSAVGEGTAALSAARPTAAPSPSIASVPPARLSDQEMPDGPVALVPRRVVLPAATPGTAILVPFAPNTAAAMFTRGPTTFFVFDERRPIDLSGLRNDSVFGSASIRLLPAATLMQFRLPPNRAASLLPTPQGWRIAVLSTSPRLGAIVPANADGRIMLPADAPGQVVTIIDPDSGATLLVGTQHRTGQGVLTPRRGAEFTLFPTTQGVVAEPLADRVTLRIVGNGFVLTGEPDGLLLSPGSDSADLAADAAGLTRRFLFPSMSTRAQSAHLIDQLDETATVPLQARGPYRVAAARSMLALGMAAEAQAMLQVAAEQAPREGLSAEMAGLSGIAALLAGRLDDSAGLMDPRLSGNDEVSLWRAVRGAMRQQGSPRAAAVMASTARLALTYPAPIRDRILPIMLETMILGGEEPAAARLLRQRKDDPVLAFARALQKESEGDIAGALAAYDALTEGHDQRDRSRAAVRAVELRLATGEIDAHAAADRLDKLLYAWRGDGVELDLRDRIATLRQQANEWTAALALRRSIEADFPDVAAASHAKLLDMFAALLKDDTVDRLAPLDLITLIDENADLLPAGPEGEALQVRLADRLVALDLPKRADPVLDKLIRTAPTDTGRATFGERLATLRLREGDAAGTLAALDASKASELPDALTESRTMLFASANARLGNLNAATAALATLGSAAADEARAAILEKAQDWPAAEQALREYVTKTIPESGSLDDGQRRTVLRLTTAAARANDDAMLADLRTHQLERMGEGPLADMFRLLTVEPVRASADLKRAGQEAGLVRSIPTGLKALQPTGSP
ncbi:MAG: hypothetical protein P4L71_09450 [Acetobacteraceae bacterium]|nr:hypothetical protein [Acetobacteraceae bacterium]